MLSIQIAIHTPIQHCTRLLSAPPPCRYPIVIVNFYAPWCHWCQRLAPTWEAATRAVHDKYPEHDGRIRLAKASCLHILHILYLPTVIICSFWEMHGGSAIGACYWLEHARNKEPMHQRRVAASHG